MLASWNWLKELVDFGREVSAEEGARALTSSGLEVEEFRPVGDDFTGVVIAEVVSKEAHPNADKLTVVHVRDSEDGDTTLVICGAPNVPEPGGRVLWAKPGAVLPGGFELGSKKLKGIESAGMLCAEDELGLGDDHDGIIVLGEDAKDLPLGADAATALGLKDVVFDLCIPANRADALGHVGIARELAALLDGRALLPDADLSTVTDNDSTCQSMISVSIADADACPRYVARAIKGLTIKASPLWMQQRLRNVGVRPISNLVDVTNYVMFELGQPLHAFDYEKLRGQRIEVRRANASEKMTTLDDAERELVTADLLICDGEAPVALAGVMGGQTSEIGDGTSTVLLESANFEAMTIRRTAKRMGLHSDSSHRFERAVDPNGADFASRRAALLLAQLGGGKVVAGSVDVYPKVIEPVHVSMRLARCEALSGISVPVETVIETLARQGLEAKENSEGILDVLVPTARADISREVDLIEEVVRIYGFDRVPATLPQTTVRPTKVPDRKRERAHAAMVAAGFSESLTYGFTSPSRIEMLALPEGDRRNTPIKIDNPMTLEQSVMRTSLWSNLLGAVAHNQKRQVHQVRLFEQGHVFLRGPEGIEEPMQLCCVMAGKSDGWLKPGADLDFYDAKGAVISVIEGIYGISNVRFEPNPKATVLHPGISASILDSEGKEIGCVGEIHPSIRKSFDLEGRVFGFELQLEKMTSPIDRRMIALPRFPAISRDVSILVNLEIPSSQVIEIIESCEEPLLASVQILEDYRDPAHVPEGKKGMLWTLTYRVSDKTLTDKVVDKAHKAIESKLLEELGATRR
ncbi:MAG: phenylalanine--tRNA ligase subunit beta [Kofleriaceae bacterium]|nr:phenylalanine--tRNA ligase subunit beta [Kofleriaceae bacterium]